MEKQQTPSPSMIPLIAAGFFVATVLTILVRHPEVADKAATSLVDWAYVTFGPEPTCGQQ